MTTTFDHQVAIGQGNIWDLAGQNAQEHQDMEPVTGLETRLLTARGQRGQVGQLN